jgi:hypothetical protein
MHMNEEFVYTNISDEVRQSQKEMKIITKMIRC